MSVQIWSDRVSKQNLDLYGNCGVANSGDIAGNANTGSADQLRFDKKSGIRNLTDLNGEK